MNAPVSARHARSLSRSILVTVLAFTLVAVCLLYTSDAADE